MCPNCKNSLLFASLTKNVANKTKTTNQEALTMSISACRLVVPKAVDSDERVVCFSDFSLISPH